MAAKDEPVSDVVKRAAGGRQDYIRGDGTTAGDFLSGTRLDAAAVQTASLTTSYRIPIVGNDSVSVLLKATTLTGTVTANLYPCLSDNVSPDTTTTAAQVIGATGTLYKLNITGAGGASFAILTIVTAAVSTVQFLAGSGLAEYRAL